MGIQTSIYIYNLSCYIAAFVGSKVYAHMAYIFRAAIPVNINVVQENVLKCLRHAVFVFRGDN